MSVCRRVGRRSTCSTDCRSGSRSPGLAGYEDTNDAERLAQVPDDADHRWTALVVRYRASTNTMSRFEPRCLPKTALVEGSE